MATTITANGINFPDGSASAPSIGGTDTNTGLFTGSDIVGFATGGVERIRIDASGRLIVGNNSSRNTRLGTNNFNGLLQIESNSEAATTIARFNNGTGCSRLVLQKARGTKDSPSVVQSGDDCGQILFSAWDGDSFTNAAHITVEVDGTPGDDDMPGRLMFSTTPDGSSISQERLRITSAGKVGIGLTAPAVALDVQGGTSNTGIAIRSTDTRAQVSYIDNATTGIGCVCTGGEGDDFFIRTGSDGAKKLTIKADGKIGIGTTNPTNLLQVEGSAPVIAIRDTASYSAYSNGGKIYFQGTDSNGAVKTFAGVLGVSQSSNNGQLRLQSRNSGTLYDRLTIMADGKVGIGETTPLGNLHVKEGDSGVTNPDNSQDTVFIENSANAGITIATPNANTGYLTFADPQDSNVGQIIYRHGEGQSYANSMSFFTNAAERLRITSGGVVGIGSTSPGSSSKVFSYQSDSSAGNNIILENNYNSNGITTLLKAYRQGGAVGYALQYKDSDTRIRQGTYTNHPMELVTNDNARLTLHNDGHARFSNAISFNNETATQNRLSDYEEGNLTWYLRKSDNTSGGNDNGSIVKYTKVGRLVHISGRIRTDSVSSNSQYVFHLDGSLPFTPSTPGTSVVGHWRSQDQLDSSLTASICWGESNTTIYLYTIDSKSDYAPSANNVPASHQTNLVMTFSFTYQAS